MAKGVVSAALIRDLLPLTALCELAVNLNVTGE